jgi:primosomal protein N' (replication factor Y) (superfamily II helicase)
MLLADVVVDTAVWALDRTLTYAVPPALAPAVRLGSVVRAPLRGRKVRGWVLGVHEGEAGEGTVELAALSGRGPVLDAALVEMAAAMARRTVHPVASFLRLFTPPRLGRPGRGPAPAPPAQPAPGPHRAVLVRLGPAEDPVERYAALVRSSIDEGGGAIVVVPEVREGSRVLEGLAALFPGEAAVVHSGLDPAERSAALWSVAAGERPVVLGGRAAVFAPPLPLGGGGVIVVHAEHDRSLKEQRAPYYDARDAALVRARATGASLVLASTTPSLRSLVDAERGVWEWSEPDRRAERAVWPAVELLEPPPKATASGVPRRAIAAIIEARRLRERTLVLLPRAQPTRAGPGPEQVARFIERVVPGARVQRADRPGLGKEPGTLAAALEADVVVATEAALADVERPRISTAVALGVDALLLRPAGRAVEEAFAALWTLGGLVAGNRSRHGAGWGLDGHDRRAGRLLLETQTPEHHVIQALTRGDYHYFADRELARRRETGSPPFRRLIRVTSPSAPEADVVEAFAALPGTLVLGPVPAGGGMEVLLKVTELEAVLAPLRRLVSTSRQRLLVEVDARDW